MYLSTGTQSTCSCVSDHRFRLTVFVCVCVWEQVYSPVPGLTGSVLQRLQPVRRRLIRPQVLSSSRLQDRSWQCTRAQLQCVLHRWMFVSTTVRSCHGHDSTAASTEQYDMLDKQFSMC